ncbi:unnamed protein product [Mesocestoides corti]|uniref:Uncharacterized protein n=1 Tax=Mesocestoides corti TaxID=53468 RepID=A0A0R3U479_MESCO|nr:unnamed protein product [Mesocestoides corti]
MGPCIPKFTATSVNRRPITPSLNLAPYCLPQDHTVLQRFPTQARSASLSFFITVYQTKLAMVDATFTCKEVVVAMEWAYREWHAETYVCPLSTVTACLPDSVPNSEEEIQPWKPSSIIEVRKNGDFNWGLTSCLPASPCPLATPKMPSTVHVYTSSS